jgi:hypothetical protein
VREERGFGIGCKPRERGTKELCNEAYHILYSLPNIVRMITEAGRTHLLRADEKYVQNFG